MEVHAHRRRHAVSGDGRRTRRGYGVTGRALERGLWQLGVWNPRDFTTDVYRTVDDRPYGGGPGMVMLAEPLAQALAAAARRAGGGGRRGDADDLSVAGRASR